MRALGHSHVLELAERGRSKSLPERAVLLLAATYPDQNWESLAKLSIGERDDRLLRLRQRTFGNQLRGLVNCPVCMLALSVDIDIDTIRSEVRNSAGQYTAGVAGYDVRFRLPNSGDVLAVMKSAEPERQWLQLFERCVLEARYEARTVTAAALPPEVVEEVSCLIDEADPKADLRLAMECPACGNFWRQTFDIVSFLWDEVTALARQLLLEVHALASAYGWSEAQILRMSPGRRGLYLAMVNA